MRSCVPRRRTYEREVQEEHRTPTREYEITHAKFFCSQAQSYQYKPVASIATNLILNISMAAVL